MKEPLSFIYEITGDNAWDGNGSRYFEVKDADGEVLFTIDSDGYELANRLVACVNACRGIPTEELTGPANAPPDTQQCIIQERLMRFLANKLGYNVSDPYDD